MQGQLEHTKVVDPGVLEDVDGNVRHVLVEAKGVGFGVVYGTIDDYLLNFFMKLKYIGA